MLHLGTIVEVVCFDQHYHVPNFRLLGVIMTTTSTTRNPSTVAPTTQPNTEGGKKTKAQPTGQKLLIRHLPPLITEQEVQAILGEEWKTGNGRVDWAQFQQGKVSKRYASVS